MCGSRLQRVVLLLFVLVAAGSTPDAAAQLGKLKKALGDKAADKTVGCLGASAPAPVQTVSLSAAQMAAINAGLDAELKAAPAAFEDAERRQKESEKEAKAYEKARADYDKRNEKYQACADKVGTEEAAKQDELNQRASDAGAAAGAAVDEDEMTKLAARAQAAAERVSQGKGTAEDRQTLAQFQQMMGGVQSASNQAVAAQQEAAAHERGGDARVEKACGVPPTEPVPPAGTQLAGDVIRKAGHQAARGGGAGAGGAGGSADMSEGDYHIQRETLIALAMSNAVVQSSNQRSQQETDAMNQQIKETRSKICQLRSAGVPL